MQSFFLSINNLLSVIFSIKVCEYTAKNDAIQLIKRLFYNGLSVV